MPRNRKPALYALLKSSGLPLSTSYIEYKTDQLIAELEAAGIPIPDFEPAPPVPTARQVPPVPPVLEDPDPVALPDLLDLPDPGPARPPLQAKADPREMAGQRLHSQPVEEPIRIDENGRLWYQEEVLKPAYPKPRGRRVLKYIEHGVEKKTVQNGEYIETFEIAGEGPGRPAEVKITLPSYQVGIYKDPRFPFKIHCYNSREGFDFFEVNDFYGGSDLVPETCKRIYIENDLCYDIRTVIRTIQAEYRQLQLTGKI